MISSGRNEEMSSGIDEMEPELDAGGNARITGFFAMHCENSQGLRKFHNHSENFAIPAKFRYAQFFAIIAKVTVHSKNLNFRYASHFCYDSEISLS